MAWSDGLNQGSPTYEIASCENARLRVVAGPGTGKSYAMKRRVARLLELGVEASSILPVTFTRVAAEDLHRELVGMNVQGCDELEGRTLHSLAFKVLMSEHALAATGRVARPLNEFELEPLLADISDAHGGKRIVKKRIKAFEAAWARLQSDEPGYVQSAQDAALERELISWLIFHESMLIGEAIPLLYQYVRNNPAAPICAEFSHILVDEYQDLNKAEQGIIQLMSENAEVCIVGDDDQSIYSFKHAHPDGIRQWLTANAGAADIELAECRRCPTRVVDMGNALISHNQDRPVPRALNPRAQNGPGEIEIIQYNTIINEINGVAALIENLVANGTPPGDILVLAQRSVIGTPIYESLVQREVPTRSYYAESELSAADAQRRFALLKLFVSREDRVALRWLLGLNSNNWRAGAYRRLRAHCESTGASPWIALEQLSSGAIAIPYCGSLIQQFNLICEYLARLEALPGLADVVNELLPDNNADLRDLRALALQTLDIVAGDREEFLVELTSLIAKPEVPTEVSDVRIMSLHKSKGLSSPVTIIAGCVQGLLPRLPDASLPLAERQAQIEEQRRLFYVGITRVKSVPEDGKPGRLVLTSSRQMPVADAMKAGIQPAQTYMGNAYLNASQFFRELGPSAPAPRQG
ncbi:MAG: ATP-dependent helicase [Nitrococcus mobilis]|nr:ATP-dependent helicase [Nitrococcus mobilis]